MAQDTEELTVPGLQNLGNTCYLNVSLQARFESSGSASGRLLSKRRKQPELPALSPCILQALACCSTLLDQLSSALEAPGNSDGPPPPPPASLAAALLQCLRSLQPRPSSGAALRCVAPRRLVAAFRSRLPAGVLEPGEEHDSAEAVEELCRLASEELEASFASHEQRQLTARAALQAVLAGLPGSLMQVGGPRNSFNAGCSDSSSRNGHASGSSCNEAEREASDEVPAAQTAGAAAAVELITAAAAPAAPPAAPAAAAEDAVLATWRRVRLPLQGSNAHELQCLRCRHRSAVQLTPFWVLPLCIPTARGQTLLGNVAASPGACVEACLASYYSYEMLQGVHCTRCSLAASLEAAVGPDTEAAAAAAAAQQGGSAEQQQAAALPPVPQQLRQTLAFGGQLIESDAYEGLLAEAGGSL